VEPLRQEPEAPQTNATSRGLRRIPPPAGAGGFIVAGLKTEIDRTYARYTKIRDKAAKSQLAESNKIIALGRDYYLLYH
jgi:hypothetical protein